MKGKFKVVKENEIGEEDFPEAKVTKQYKTPIGPEKPSTPTSVKQYVTPAGPKAPSTKEKLEMLFEPEIGEIKSAAGFTKSRISNASLRIEDIVTHQTGVPIWLHDTGKKGKSKLTRFSGEGLPSWVFGGGMPWDRTRRESDVERVIVTRVHSDGRKTRSIKKPKRTEIVRDRPSWIQF